MAEGKTLLGSDEIRITASRALFCRGKYEVLLESGSSSRTLLKGDLPTVTEGIRGKGASTKTIAELRELASAINDTTPYFLPAKAGKNDCNSRFLTAKEASILVALDMGIDTIATISSAYGMSSGVTRIGLIELNSGGYIESSWGSRPKRFRLSESGKKFIAKAKDEAPISSCKAWLEGRIAEMSERYI